MTGSVTFKRIRLELARTREHPAGSPLDGYEFVAPLDGTDHIDVEAWRANRDRCRVRRFRAGEPDEIGRLVYKSGGAGRARWAFHYADADPDDDESGYRFGEHAFVSGEYVSVRDEDEGELQTFVVVSVERP